MLWATQVQHCYKTPDDEHRGMFDSYVGYKSYRPLFHKGKMQTKENNPYLAEISHQLKTPVGHYTDNEDQIPTTRKPYKKIFRTSEDKSPLIHDDNDNINSDKTKSMSSLLQQVTRKFREQLMQMKQKQQKRVMQERYKYDISNLYSDSLNDIGRQANRLVTLLDKKQKLNKNQMMATSATITDSADDKIKVKDKARGLKNHNIDGRTTKESALDRLENKDIIANTFCSGDLKITAILKDKDNQSFKINKDNLIVGKCDSNNPGLKIMKIGSGKTNSTPKHRIAMTEQIKVDEYEKQPDQSTQDQDNRMDEDNMYKIEIDLSVCHPNYKIKGQSMIEEYNQKISLELEIIYDQGKKINFKSKFGCNFQDTLNVQTKIKNNNKIVDTKESEIKNGFIFDIKKVNQGNTFEISPLNGFNSFQFISIPKSCRLESNIISATRSTRKHAITVFNSESDDFCSHFQQKFPNSWGRWNIDLSNKILHRAEDVWGDSLDNFDVTLSCQIEICPNYHSNLCGEKIKKCGLERVEDFI